MGSVYARAKAGVVVVGLVAAAVVSLAETSKHRLANESSATTQPAPCSREAIRLAALDAPWAFEANDHGRLYGVSMWREETRVGWFRGYNACPLVVSAVLRHAGCAWVPETMNAKLLFDTVAASGWQREAKAVPGCLLAWNSRWRGPWARLGAAEHAAKSHGVLYRQLGISLGSWLSMDNSSFLGRPIVFPIDRPLNYEAPIILCPPEPPRSAERSP